MFVDDYCHFGDVGGVSLPAKSKWPFVVQPRTIALFQWICDNLISRADQAGSCMQAAEV